MGDGAVADLPIYEGGRRIILQQQSYNLPRQPVTLGLVPARAATKMEDFIHQHILSLTLGASGGQRGYVDANA
jgi:hypothetical protein